MQGELEITQVWDAVLVEYTWPNQCIRCTSDSQKNAAWLFKGVPQDEWLSLKEEFAKDDAAVQVHQWILALKAIQHYEKSAKQQLGCWTHKRYTER